MLATTVTLHDIADVEAFVGATLARSGIRFTPDEHETLIAEGIAILYKLARDYEPRRGEHTRDGRFSGYAAYMLPKRLTDAWHQAHREHSLATDPATGKRRWTYGPAPVSFDALDATPEPAADDDPTRQQIADLKSALTAAALHTAHEAVQYSALVAAGYRPIDARNLLGIDHAHARTLTSLIARAMPVLHGATAAFQP